jgi:hypothetical protein
MKRQRKLFLRESHARQTYLCVICSSPIRRRSLYYRDEPHPFDRFRGRGEVKHLCVKCVQGIDPERKKFKTPPSHPPSEIYEHQLILPFGSEAVIHQTRVQLISVTSVLLERLRIDYEEIYNIGPENFEYLIQDRLYAMGFDAERVGHPFRKDGGIDIVFWPRPSFPVPFLGAVQLKHHRSAQTKSGPAAIREMAGVINAQPFHFGLVVTNTTFTPDAEWFASQQQAIIRLRDMSDLKRWIASNFTDEAEWREMPSVLELCPGVTIDLKKRIFHRGETSNKALQRRP